MYVFDSDTIIVYHRKIDDSLVVVNNDKQLFTARKFPCVSRNGDAYSIANIDLANCYTFKRGLLDLRISNCIGHWFGKWGYAELKPDCTLIYSNSVNVMSKKMSTAKVGVFSNGQIEYIVDTFDSIREIDVSILKRTYIDGKVDVEMDDAKFGYECYNYLRGSPENIITANVGDHEISFIEFSNYGIIIEPVYGGFVFGGSGYAERGLFVQGNDAGFFMEYRGEMIKIRR